MWVDPLVNVDARDGDGRELDIEGWREWFLSRREGTELVISAAQPVANHLTRLLDAEQLREYMDGRFGEYNAARRGISMATFSPALSAVELLQRMGSEDQYMAEEYRLAHCPRCDRRTVVVGEAWSHVCPVDAGANDEGVLDCIRDQNALRGESATRPFRFAFEALDSGNGEWFKDETAPFGLEQVIWPKLRMGGEWEYLGFFKIIGDTNLNMPILVEAESTPLFIAFNAIGRLFSATLCSLPDLDVVPLRRPMTTLPSVIAALIDADNGSGQGLIEHKCNKEDCHWRALYKPPTYQHFCVGADGAPLKLASNNQRKIKHVATSRQIDSFVDMPRLYKSFLWADFHYAGIRSGMTLDLFAYGSPSPVPSTSLRTPFSASPSISSTRSPPSTFTSSFTYKRWKPRPVRPPRMEVLSDPEFSGCEPIEINEACRLVDQHYSLHVPTIAKVAEDVRLSNKLWRGRQKVERQQPRDRTARREEEPEVSASRSAGEKHKREGQREPPR